MDESKIQEFKIVIPGSLDYVSPVRNLVAELLQVHDYSRKFAYRSEVIVDEICSNAIQYGCKNRQSTVELTCLISEEKFEVHVKDEGGDHSDVQSLKKSIGHGNLDIDKELTTIKKFARRGFGLEIVRMLSEKVELLIGENNVTTLKVVRKKSLS